MSGTLKVKFYSDPGHSWGAIKRKTLVDLGIDHMITPYSYQKGQTVYLEEDCDLPVLVSALALKGIKIEYQNKHTNNRSPVRTYEPFKV